MSLHTKGTWEIAPKQHREGLIVWTAKDHLHIGYITTDGDCEYHISEDIQEANARLIAAAPDLLEALKKIDRDITNELNAVQNGTFDTKTLLDFLIQINDHARAAIAKATGGAA